jgi:hypothetical protein
MGEILMKKIKSIIYFGMASSLTILVFLATVSGASVTVQREGALQNDQESLVVTNDVIVDGNQLTFSPRQLKNKTDFGMESAGNQPVTRERYKPYQEGEGERKIK